MGFLSFNKDTSVLVNELSEANSRARLAEEKYNEAKRQIDRLNAEIRSLQRHLLSYQQKTKLRVGAE